MKWNPKDPHAPFSPTGDLQHYPESTGYGADRKPPEFRPVPAWFEALTLDDYARGRSAAYFVFVGKDGARYPMMLADFAELVKTRQPDRPGRFFARWAVAKRGQNYGIRLAKESDR